MNNYSSDKLAFVCGGKIYPQGAAHVNVSHISTDSRKIIFPDTSLFVAICGTYHDGHQFLHSAYHKGVRCFLVSALPPTISDFHHTIFIVVSNTVHALQQITGWHRKQFQLPVIGITGSNGKTIVKEWLSQLLSPTYQVVKSPGSFNSQTGVPLSLWHINATHTLGLFEAGISQPGEMERLADCMRPDIGVFTMIGEAHSENFNCIEEKIKEKLRLFIHTHTLIYSRDHSVLHHEIAKSDFLKGVRFFTWSEYEDADLRILNKVKEGKNTRLTIRTHKDFEIVLPFTEPALIENAIHCMAVLTYLNISTDEIIYSLPQLQPIAMRLEMKKGVNGCSVINDAYNADMDSVRIALQYLIELGNKKKKTLFLSDIHQSNRPASDLYASLARLVNEAAFSRLFLIGPYISAYHAYFNHVEQTFENTDELLKALPGLHFKDEDILIKGARSFELERIESFLIEKTHATVLEINLNAVAHNFNYYKSLLAPGIRIMAMVKAASYGTGDVEIAQLLEYYKADYLAVAYTDEGIQLRNEGVGLPIMVMSPEDEHYERMARYRLEPELYSIRSLQRFLVFARGYNGNLPAVHIKVDTGMHRLGYNPSDISELCMLLSQNPFIRVASIFSHLSASDTNHYDSFTEMQVERFISASVQIADTLGYMPLRHILNSSGIERFPESQFDMVRLGIGLYGIGSNEEQTARLMEVVRLKTRISQVRVVQAGDSVGYARDGISTQKRVIATVPLGYADGFRRSLSNGVGAMLVNGKLAPVVGRVCMDMTMIDITDIQAEEGDEVIVMGHPPLTVSEIAQQMGTIPYEVLTGLSHRLKRIFVKE
ncbi:MAG: bifunctional UDP-N-acetylmuramoyl-tripeptide:D-alanyl-D-alanine ligase/alanine racemase [Candidatus Competibacteraceae bacterium]|nr:bifunctional UDP-N-acetylmuramoyl-tripeptide:D-alanyl-D-alanine ligase/alanine racemase [Candidatus Competibacteraceae bacterium]